MNTARFSRTLVVAFVLCCSVNMASAQRRPDDKANQSRVGTYQARPTHPSAAPAPRPAAAPAPRPAYNPPRPNPAVKPAAKPARTVAHDPPRTDAHRDRRHDSRQDAPRVVRNYVVVPASGGPYYDPYWNSYAWPYNYYPAYLTPSGSWISPTAWGWVPVDNGPQVSGSAAPPIVDEGADPDPEPKIERATNARSVALGQRYIGYGDKLFVQEKYADANDRYRKAIQSAPQLAEAYFRQSFVQAALGRYDLAVAAIKRGLAIDPKWPNSGFDIDQLYGNNAALKRAHLDELAQAALDEPNNADLVFLVGVSLHFDGQTQRAEPFFRHALELSGNNAEHVWAFLKKQDAAT